MNDIEQQLFAELDEVRDRLGPTDVDLPGLVGLARRERARHRAVGAGIAAAVAVVATTVGLAVVPDSDRRVQPVAVLPTAVTDLAVGAPTDVAWWSGGALHLDGTAYASTMPEWLVHRAGTTVVDSGSAITVRRDGEQPFVLPARATDVQVSADGLRVAWAEALGEQPPTRREQRDAPLPGVRIASYDVAQREVSSFERTLPAFCCDDGSIVDVAGVLADGTVLLETYGTAAAEAWTPGSQPLVLDLPEGTYISAGHPEPPDLAVLLTGLDSGDLVVAIGADGSTDDVRGRIVGAGDWSPDGRFWAGTYGNSARATAFGESQAQTVTLPLPTDHGWRPVAWESETQVVLVSEDLDDGGRTIPEAVDADLVRCDVVAVTCERVGGTGTGPIMVSEPHS